MKKLDRIIIGGFYKYFLATFFITYFIVLLSLLYDKLPVILNKNLGVKLYLQIIGYLMVFVSPYISVFSSILGSILFIVRFDYDLQLTALKSLGIGIKRIFLSMTIGFVLLGGIIFGFTNFLSPYFKKKCYDIFRNLDNLDPSLNIKSGIFINDIPNLGIYIGSKNGSNIRDVIVYTHNKNVLESLFIAKNGTVSSNHDTKITSVELNDGFNYGEGKLFNDLIKNKSKKNDVNIRNTFKRQNIFINMKDIFKMSSFYESLSDINSKRIFLMLKDDKNSIEKKISKIMELLNTDYRPIFDEISEKKEILLKNRIYESLKNNSFNRNVFDKADEFKNKYKNLFNEMNNYYYEVKEYNVELLKRNLEIIGCFLLVIIGTYLGFLLRRGVLILPIIIASIIVSLYFLGETLAVRYIKYDSIFYLFKKSGGFLILVLTIIMYLILIKIIRFISKSISNFKKRRKTAKTAKVEENIENN